MIISIIIYFLLLFWQVSETSWSEYHINSLLQDALGLYHEDLADR